MTETARRSRVAAEPPIEVGRKTYPALEPDITVGAGLALMLSNSIHALRLASHRAAERPETVHRFRVVLRRLRSLLSACGAILPRDERRAFSQRLGSIARGYGNLREWDVFLAGTLQPMAEAMPEEPALMEIDAAARAARQRALPDPARLKSEAADIIAVIEAAPWLAQPAPGLEDDWNGNLKEFLGALLTKRHRRMRKHLRTVNIADQADFHPFRVETKKLRYPIEMFRDLFHGKAVAPYLDALVAVQDTLGHMNDALIAQRLAAALTLSQRAQGVLQGWLVREIMASRQAFPQAAKRLRKAEPFWEE